MSDLANTSEAILRDIAAALDMSEAAVSQVQFTGEDRLPSCFPVTSLAAASIGAAGLALAELTGDTRDVVVDHRLASLWFGFSIQPQGWQIAAAWDPLAGDYQTQDGWIKLHTNAPHHRAAALSVLGCDGTREAVGEAARTWDGAALEDAIVAAGGCAAALRSRAQWAAHPQGQAVAAEPLVAWDTLPAPVASAWRPAPSWPLAGLRVLDLTRVLAGPVATRFLAGYGAQVLRIDPPEWEEPGVIPEVTLGKRCARLDLKSAAGRDRFAALLAEADVLVHGYRADALEGLGLGAAARQAIRPGLIDVSLHAYGHTGPWANRRGFDSLVQLSCGIAADGMAWRRADAPVSLPVQALDQATGYLMAAAVLRGLTARLRGEGAVAARLSLARTAHLLVAHKGAPSDAAFAPVSEADLSPVIENTLWGPVRRIAPPLHIADCPMAWDLPAAALGSSPPDWI